MENQLPSDFDLVVVGTGMVESIISAAASRVGKRVLHIDRNDFYGGYWASFNLDAFQKLQQNSNSVLVPIENFNDILKEGEEAVTIGNSLFNIENLKFDWHIPEKKIGVTRKIDEITEEEETPEIINDLNDESNTVTHNNWTQECILKDSRKFNIDLAPKLQFARGDFVELLISSNIARYSEYKTVSRVLTWLNNQLEVVPCSRSDVFANSKVSVIEKRMLMKLLTSLDEGSEELRHYENKSFYSFLKDKKLTPNLIHYVLYAISMSTKETSCHQGVENTKRFLNSLGRFGKTPFLFSMYGSGETAQAFCRLSAVFGGIFALGQPVDGLVFAKNEFKGLLVGKQRINASDIVMSIERSPEKFVQSFSKKQIGRAVFVTDRSIMDSEKEHLTLLLYPPENNKNLVTIIELGTLTGTCPSNLFVVHLISSQTSTPEDDFKHVVENLFSTYEKEKVNPTNKPNILWSSYFSLPDSNHLDLNKYTPKDVYLCPGPDLDLDYDLSVKKAKEIFLQMYPDMEFLPRAPDPEEIIIEGEDEENLGKTEEIEKTENSIIDELVHNLENQSINEAQTNEDA